MISNCVRCVRTVTCAAFVSCRRVMSSEDTAGCVATTFPRFSFTTTIHNNVVLATVCIAARSPLFFDFLILHTAALHPVLMLPEEPASATLPNTQMMYPVYPNTKMQIHWIYTIVRSTLTTAQCARTPKKISTLVTYINPQNHQYSHSLGLTELNILHVRKPHGGATSSIAQLQLTIQKKEKEKKRFPYNTNSHQKNTYAT
jgi:hypothetical protein